MNRESLVDVRKLELVSKRTLVSDGAFGLTGSVLGSFTDNLIAGFRGFNLRTPEQLKIYCGRKHFEVLQDGVEIWLESITDWGTVKKRL